MCISKYVYGDYNDIIRLFEYELALRKECDHWLIYDSPSCQPGGNVWVYVKPWPCFVCVVDNKKKKKKKISDFIMLVCKTYKMTTKIYFKIMIVKFTHQRLYFSV